ncbi:MAG: STAS domain-containing protein [Gallionellaceae bacterium]|nr:STAS domain-containing protein [Gallionellaceae bacterium]
MFDFFRKDKGSHKPVIPDEPPVATVPAPAEPAAAPDYAISANDGVMIQEMDVQLTPEIEEAVVLYSSGNTSEATAALNRFILNNPDKRDPQPWQLLFDIYEATGQRQPFEDLAMDYALRFERSPPTWRPGQAVATASATGNRPTFAFGAHLSPQDKAGLEHFLRECETADSAILDFNKTPVPDNDAYARTLLDCVSRLAASGKPIHLAGSEAFVVRLNATRSDDDRLSEPLWLLLLMLLQLQGKADAFEAAAVEYAIRFEISPPSYASPKCIAAAPEAAPLAGPSGQVFPMHGLIDTGSAAVFDELREFAASLAEIEIDLGQVTRIDFMVIGLLMDIVMTLAQAGKRVIFKEGSEMVCLLLEMVGVGQFAAIQPKVRK